MNEFIKEFIEFNVSRILKNIDKLKVDCTLTTKNVIVEITADKSDIGKIVGKNGQMIRAINIICSSAKITKYPNDSRKLLIEVLENEDYRSNIKTV